MLTATFRALRSPACGQAHEYCADSNIEHRCFPMALTFRPLVPDLPGRPARANFAALVSELVSFARIVLVSVCAASERCRNQQRYA